MDSALTALPCVSGTVSGTVSLADLAPGQLASVVSVRGAASDAELVLRLVEIGFLSGEVVRVIARGWPGAEPVAVRVGGTTFALRRFEADRVLVNPIMAAA